MDWGAGLVSGASLTAAEFSLLEGALHGPGGRARAAARRVLVEGVVPAEAARSCGVTQAAVARVVARLVELRSGGCPTCGRSLVPGAKRGGGE